MPTTPFFELDLRKLRENYAEFKNTLAKAFPRNEIAYSVKTNSLPQVVQELAHAGSGMEAASLRELKTALAAKATAKSSFIVLNSPAKTRAEIRLAEKNQVVSPASLSKYLHVSKNTVSQMLLRLHKERLVKYEKYSRAIELTKKGRGIAIRLTYRHRLIERFLVDVLETKAEKVHEEANRLEHAFSDESIKKISEMLGKPNKDPHGRPIPKIA